jgi:hypothetical protein
MHLEYFKMCKIGPDFSIKKACLFFRLPAFIGTTNAMDNTPPHDSFKKNEAADGTPPALVRDTPGNDSESDDASNNSPW